MRVKFSREFDYDWPSRAVTHFPEGYEGTVKAEVGQAAIDAGAATDTSTAAPATPAAPKRRGRPARVKADAAPDGPEPVEQDAAPVEQDALPAAGDSD